MKVNDSAIIGRPTPSLSRGSLLAAVGVVSFSFSFPATSWALQGFGPWNATGIRGTGAAVIAILTLCATRSRLPSRRDWPALAVVAGGCAVGFPLLTTLALQTSSTAHSAVVIGALPMATATIAALRTGRRPSALFWTAATVGATTVIGFALWQNHGTPTVADLYLFAALLVCAAGYAEGGRLSSRLPGWQVIAWAVVIAAPVNLVLTVVALPAEPVHLTGLALLGMAYVAAISQFGGFVFWYRGMSLIGVERASQLQLAQPLLTLVWAALILGEHFTAAVPLTAAVVLSCIVITQRARV
jgi:drug/metabolite transporter (DMT)-like permease